MKKPNKAKVLRTQPKPPKPRPLPPDVKPLVVTVPVAGAMLGLNRNAAYLAARRGDIHTIKFGGRYRVPTAWLEKVLSGDKVQP